MNVSDNSPISDEELWRKSDAHLREALKRCSATTYIAAREFRKTGDIDLLPTIVRGVIERYVERNLRGKLKHPSDDLRLVDDLGLDSLSMLEIVILAEEVLSITIDGTELRNLRTLGEVVRVVECVVNRTSKRPPIKRDHDMVNALE